MSHPNFQLATYSMLGMVGLFGLNATFRPNNHLGQLGFPVPTEPEARRFSQALMRIWGIRNICICFMGTLICRTGDEKLMATSLTAGIAIATVDGWVSRGLIGGGEAQHWVFPPVIAIVMAGLLGYFD